MPRAASPGPTPTGPLVAIGVLGSIVAACLWVATHPRWYLEVDTFRESARYVGPDGENVMPLSELFPLYVGRIVTASTDGRGRENVTFRVLTSAAPVVLAEAPTLEDAERKVRRLSAKLGLEVAEIPEKTEHMKPWETDS